MFYTLPPYISLAILAKALWILKGLSSHKSQISKYRIAVQLSAGFAYALSNTILYIKGSEKTATTIWYIATLLDWLSLLILTGTLFLISNL